MTNEQVEYARFQVFLAASRFIRYIEERKADPDNKDKVISLHDKVLQMLIVHVHAEARDYATFLHESGKVHDRSACWRCKLSANEP